MAFVDYITYKDKKYPVRISFTALVKLKKETGKDFESEFELELLEPLLWFSLQSGYQAEGRIFDIKREDVEWMLDECLYEFVRIIPLFMARMKEQTETKGTIPDLVKVKKKG